jgi:hypothetical protein
VFSEVATKPVIVSDLEGEPFLKIFTCVSTAEVVTAMMLLSVRSYGVASTAKMVATKSDIEVASPSS